MHIYPPLKRHIQNIQDAQFIFIIGSRDEIKEARADAYSHIDVSDPFSTDIIDIDSIPNEISAGSASFFLSPSMREHSIRTFIFRINKEGDAKKIKNIVEYFLFKKNFKNRILVEYQHNHERRTKNFYNTINLFKEGRKCVFIEYQSSKIIYTNERILQKIFYSVKEKEKNISYLLEEAKIYGFSNNEIIRYLLTMSYNDYIKNPSPAGKKMFHSLEYIYYFINQTIYPSIMLDVYLQNIHHL